MAKSKRTFTAFLSVSLVVSPLFYVLAGKQLPALSQDEENTGTTSDPIKKLPPAYLRVCNRTNGEKISIAIAQRKEGVWTSKGWWSPAPNECQTIGLGRYEGEVLYYAKGAGKYWTSDNTFCINQQQAFNIPNSLRNSRNECPQGLVGVGMRSLQIGRGETRTLNLR
jgi:uncharacterized membrane protein